MIIWRIGAFSPQIWREYFLNVHLFSCSSECTDTNWTFLLLLLLLLGGSLQGCRRDIKVLGTEGGSDIWCKIPKESIWILCWKRIFISCVWACGWMSVHAPLTCLESIEARWKQRLSLNWRYRQLKTRIRLVFRKTSFPNCECILWVLVCTF